MFKTVDLPISPLSQILFAADDALADRLCQKLVESEQFHALYGKSVRMRSTIAGAATNFLEVDHSTGTQLWGPQLSALDRTLCAMVQSPLLAGVMLKLVQMARIYCQHQSAPLEQIRVHIPYTLLALEKTYKAMECAALMSPDVIDRLTADLNALIAS